MPSDNHLSVTMDRDSQIHLEGLIHASHFDAEGDHHYHMDIPLTDDQVRQIITAFIAALALLPDNDAEIH